MVNYFLGFLNDPTFLVFLLFPVVEDIAFGEAWGSPDIDPPNVNVPSERSLSVRDSARTSSLSGVLESVSNGFVMLSNHPLSFLPSSLNFISGFIDLFEKDLDFSMYRISKLL